MIVGVVLKGKYMLYMTYPETETFDLYEIVKCENEKHRRFPALSLSLFLSVGEQVPLACFHLQN